MLRSKDKCGTGNAFLAEKLRKTLTNEAFKGELREDAVEGRYFRTVKGPSVMLKHLEGLGKQLANS